ncbi:MAG: DUF255 domain-containing protein [Actinobacteria bacterium]|nr:DUF255 domain-containing protein [Actinomycetota bacterium]
MRRRESDGSAGFNFSPGRNRASQINWHPWSSASFARAEEADRPIFLLITTFWSGRSHLMDETTFSDWRVIRELNRRFIPVRVDGDRRPDVSDRYLFNGWPTAAFLTPDGDIIASRNFTGAEELLNISRKITTLYRNFGREMRFEAQSGRRDLLSLELDWIGRSCKFNPGLAPIIVGTLVNSYNQAGGSFGENDKLPNPAALELLMRTSRQQRPALLEMATSILSKMATGGLYDRIQGGFYRCSAGKVWGSPDRAKLLSVNAALIANYLLAYRLTRTDHYRELAFGSIDYVSKNLLAGDSGGFFASEDSSTSRPRRLTGGGRPLPRIDRTIFTDQNCSMVNAYLDAHLISREGQYLDYALATLDLLWSKCFEPDRGMAHYLVKDGAHLFGHLNDQAWAIYALARAGAVTGERGHVVRAIELLDIASAALYEEGGFCDLPFNAYSNGLLKMKLRPISGNAVMARALALLASLTDNREYLELAERILGSLKVETILPTCEMSEYGLSIFEIAQASSTYRRKAA